jgi:hypothetical protein
VMRVPKLAIVALIGNVQNPFKGSSCNCLHANHRCDGESPTVEYSIIAQALGM